MDLLRAYALMWRSRAFEDEVERLFARGALYGTTHLATGQEAAQAGLCMALDDEDWIMSTHRCHGYAVCRGTDTYRLFCELFGSRHGVCKGLAGSMHFQDTARHNAGSSAIVGSGIPPAAGIALTLKRHRKNNISVSIFGDGACSRGTLHETMNLCAVWHLPLLFFCENNLYGMSASSSRMISTDSISSRAAGYGIAHETVDGNDVEAVYNAVKKAREYIVSNQEPYFLEVLTYRQKGHSKNDRCVYRTREEEQYWLQRDPISLLEKNLLNSGKVTENELRSIRDAEKETVSEALILAEGVKDEVLSIDEARNLTMAPETYLGPQPHPEQGKVTLSFREALRMALDLEMGCNEDVILMGEDIGAYGGCFKVTGDLYLKHPDQVLETPVSEESFCGVAVGSAKTGLRPVVEVMYADFSTLISDPVINHAAKSWFMSGGKVCCPLVVRLPEGSGTGHGPQHTQTPAAMFLNVPGLIVLAPSCPQDAYGLLTLAIRSNNPVIFLEHKLLYPETQTFDPSEPVLPIGKARVARNGKDVTLIAYSQAVNVCLNAASLLEKQGVSAEVIDLRSLKPLDTQTILESVRKTGRAVIVQWANSVASASSEVESVICSDAEAFEALKKPVIRLCSEECPTPFSKPLEKAYNPGPKQVADAVLGLF